MPDRAMAECDPPPGATWRSALDDYGRALLDYEHRYELLGHAAGTFCYRLPSGLGAMPPELLDVAAALVQRSRAMEDRVQSELDAVAVARRNIRQGRSHLLRDRPAAHYVDVRG